MTVRARQVDGFVVVTVRDDGRGFDDDERELAFDPFFRGRRARAQGTDGSGLGLYLCRQLVEGHGGRIWVDETDDGGSVSFSLPRYRPLRPVTDPELPRSRPALAVAE